LHFYTEYFVGKRSIPISSWLPGC